ncbi:MAG: hypothetical protein LBL16_01060 [Endomicrobium sp.]|nr:hypothetical protein [Endomicrobium sp.]
MYATIRAIEIIGEASTRIPLSFRADIILKSRERKRTAGMRDKLIHDYFVSILTFYGRQLNLIYRILN